MIGHSFEICAMQDASLSAAPVEVNDVSIHAMHAFNLALSERVRRFVSHVTSVRR